MRLYLTIIAIAFVAACGGGASGLRHRAAFDFHCEEAAVTTQELGSNQVGVEGCGCRGTYINARQNAIGAPDVWVLNTVSGTCGATVTNPESSPTAQK